MNPNVTVLMYHAVSDAPSDSLGADPHYAVGETAFRSCLRLAQAAGKRCASMADVLAGRTAPAAALGMTFDDGHASNLAAARMLAEVGGSADFFINPSTTGTPNHLSWPELREMAALGMSIQSHGFHHRYLDELSEADVRAELVDSKRAIEDHLGTTVTLFAPPGGRVARNLDRIAREAGYVAVCSSRVGLWRAGADLWDIPRLAVLNTTNEAQLDRWVRQHKIEILSRRARYTLLAGAKRLLGNQGYERLRQGLLRSAA